MAKLIMCKGLPGCGKSTWANDRSVNSMMSSEDVSGWIVVVNRDKIRRELEQTGWEWSFENEKQVVEIRNTRIRAALALGQTVISDDTNMSRKHKVELQDIALEFSASFEVEDFTQRVTVEECIRRDSQREGKAKVGEQVIIDMANRYHVTNREMPQFEPVPKHTHLLPNAIICDLDGTLALFGNHRSPYDASTCEDDQLNEPIADIVLAFSYQAKVLYVSGREDKYREVTESWLYHRNSMPYGPLHMRKSGDHRKDWIVKGEIFDAHIRGKYNVLFCLDDRDQVVKFWRSIGLTCLQVAEGNF